MNWWPPRLRAAAARAMGAARRKWTRRQKRREQKQHGRSQGVVQRQLMAMQGSMCAAQCLFTGDTEHLDCDTLHQWTQAVAPDTPFVKGSFFRMGTNFAASLADATHCTRFCRTWREEPATGLAGRPLYCRPMHSGMTRILEPLRWGCKLTLLWWCC